MNRVASQATRSRRIVAAPLIVLLAALTVCCDGAPAFVERRFIVAPAPGAVVLADFNGDRRLDIAVASEREDVVSILIGDGRGGFSSAKGSPFPAGHSPNDLAVGDFNRDGHVDLAVANHETQYLTVLYGDGTGSFRASARVTVAVKPHPHGVAAGDFNGDRLPDLVTDSWAENRLAVLFGDGKGHFLTPGTYVAVGRHPYQRIRVRDVNGDGHDDIVSPNLDGDNVTILLGNGKGSFHEPAGSPFACGAAPFNVAIGDVDGDGHPDVAIVNSPSSTSDRAGHDGLTILVGDGTGGFRPMRGTPFATPSFPNIVAIGDIDGDGLGDVVVSLPEHDAITILTSGRGGTRTTRHVPVAQHPKGLAVQDLNGDGRADIVVTNNASNTVTVLLSR